MTQDKNKEILIKKMLNADLDSVDIHIDFNDPALVKPLVKVSIYFKGIEEHLEHQIEVCNIKVNEIDTLLQIIGLQIIHNKVFHK